MGAPCLLVYINYGFVSSVSARAEQLSRCVLIIIPVTVINNQAYYIINCYNRNRLLSLVQRPWTYFSISENADKVCFASN